MTPEQSADTTAAQSQSDNSTYTGKKRSRLTIQDILDSKLLEKVEAYRQRLEKTAFNPDQLARDLNEYNKI